MSLKLTEIVIKQTIFRPTRNKVVTNIIMRPSSYLGHSLGGSAQPSGRRGLASSWRGMGITSPSVDDTIKHEENKSTNKNLHC